MPACSQEPIPMDERAPGRIGVTREVAEARIDDEPQWGCGTSARQALGAARPRVASGEAPPLSGRLGLIVLGR